MESLSVPLQVFRRPIPNKSSEPGDVAALVVPRISRVIVLLARQRVGVDFTLDNCSRDRPAIRAESSGYRQTAFSRGDPAGKLGRILQAARELERGIEYRSAEMRASGQTPGRLRYPHGERPGTE